MKIGDGGTPIKIEEFVGTSGPNTWSPIRPIFIIVIPETVFNSKDFLFADDLKLIYNENLQNATEIKQDLDSILLWS